MKEKQKWLILNEDDFIIVLPDSDTKPHGFPKKGEKKVELAWTDCPCQPKLSYQGEKPMIVHNSFEQMDKIEKSMSTLNL